MGCSGSVAEWEEDYGTSLEHVEIILDNGKDEVEISFVENNYSNAEPPLRQEVKPPVRWFENDDDDDDALGDDDDYDSGSIHGNNTSSKELVELQKRVTGKRRAMGISLQQISDHAKTANRSTLDSYGTLISYLTAPIDDKENAPLLTVRALIVWLSSQDVDKTNYGVKGAVETPRGYLQLIREGRATYASFFTVLCRCAAIDCILIHGICRGGEYQPGDMEVEGMDCLWTAVHIHGNWQIVHPFWVCRAMIGQKLGGWLKLESGGKTVAGVERKQQGVLSVAFKESYFMPKPSQFIYMCYPDEESMQLLPKGQLIKNKYHFLRLPYLLPPFFGLGLTLISEQSCELNSHNGTVTIEFRSDLEIAYKLNLTYDLFLKDSSSADDEMVQSRNLPRLVFNSRAEETFKFEIRFPVEGIYKLVIYGGPYGQPGLRICEFKLKCEQRLIGCQLLPLNTGINGWGHGPKAEKAGLLMPSRVGGSIPVQPQNATADDAEKVAQVKFQLDQNAMANMEYSAEMVAGGDRNEDLSRHVTCDVVEETQELNVTATVPKAGEYGLVIKAGKKGLRRKASVCNYLLTTVAAIREGVPKRKARKALKAAMMNDGDLEELANVIDKCHKVKLDDTDEDVKSANNRLAYLKMKSDLHDCHKRRNLDVTAKTLKQVEKYRHKLALIVETRRVQKLKMQLERLGGYSREVPQLGDAYEELIHTPRAAPEVCTTIRALFLLLEEPDENLKTWSQMQIMLKTTHDQKKNVMNRMKKITERTLEVKERRKISAVLQTYSEEQVRHTSQAAASFYRWINGVLAIYSGEKLDK